MYYSFYPTADNSQQQCYNKKLINVNVKTYTYTILYSLNKKF